MAGRFIEVFNSSYRDMDKMLDGEFTTVMAEGILRNSITRIIVIILPVVLIAFAVSFTIILVQVKWKLSGKPLTPKFSKLDPITGFRKIFSKDKLFALVVEVVKVILIGYVAYDTLKDDWNTLLVLYDICLFLAVALIGDIVINLGIRLSLIFLVIGFADYLYQRFRFRKDMMMTKQEVKDEFKQTEGDPQVKRRIRTKMLEVSQRRMMRGFPSRRGYYKPQAPGGGNPYDREEAERPSSLQKARTTWLRRSRMQPGNMELK